MWDLTVANFLFVKTLSLIGSYFYNSPSFSQAINTNASVKSLQTTGQISIIYLLNFMCRNWDISFIIIFWIFDYGQIYACVDRITTLKYCFLLACYSTLFDRSAFNHRKQYHQNYNCESWLGNLCKATLSVSDARA